VASINWTEQAIADLIGIADFIARDSQRYAKITVDRIRSSTKQLTAFPYSGRMVPEVSIESIRELITGNYRLIYHIVSSDQIDILTVHHSAKRLDSDELKNTPGNSSLG
jgi:toxin ParE1/3/4